MQERLEASRAGRVAISLFVLLTLLALVATNLPGSKVQHEVERAVHSYLYGAGLEQNWAVFAPDPRRQITELSAVVRYADGSRATWRPPLRDPVVGAYSDYRWLKWVEYEILNEHRPDLWRPAAEFVARQMDDRRSRPVSVTLVRRWYVNLPPGTTPRDRTRWQRYAYYTLHLRRGRG